MATCIYCPNEANSREHWIPRGLGAFRGYTPLLNQVCGDCNTRLGQLDQELIRTGLTGFQRALHGVQGRHGPPKVSPFHYKAMQADQPTKMMMPALGSQHQLLAEAYTDEEGRSSAQPIRQIVLKMPDGRLECVPFPRGWTADQLRTVISNRRLEAGTFEKIYLEDDEVVTDQEAPLALEIRTLLSLGGVVEVDETYIGGEEPGLAGGRARGKKVLTGIAVEVQAPNGVGRCRMLPLADASAASLHPFVTDHVEPRATVITDGWAGYSGLEKLGYVHDRRSQRAARACGEDPGALLPAVHRVVSLAKRWLLGTHQGSVEPAHLASYLNEFVFRFNRSFAKHSSIGFRSGLYFGRKQSVAPTVSTTARTAGLRCTDSLSSTTTSPGRSVGASTCSM